MNDTTKLFIACTTLAFISGMFTSVTLNLGRENVAEKSCTVTYQHGKQVHVLIGSRDLLGVRD